MVYKRVRVGPPGVASPYKPLLSTYRPGLYYQSVLGQSGSCQSPVTSRVGRPAVSPVNERNIH